MKNTKNKPSLRSIMKRLVIFVFLSISAPALGETVVIKTPQGQLIGTLTDGEKAITSFKGIPYAVPPVGVRRWRAPEMAPSWSGKRFATDYGPECIQNEGAPATDATEGGLYYRPRPQMSEDCLYLNVWTGSSTGAKRPVMVWIHGGGLVVGAGSLGLYDGTELARKGVVLVTINYRLGVLGNYAHPDLQKESPYGSAGNYTVLDQIQALKWVQDNIAAFGGDPDNVTIFGESGGAKSVRYLVATPLSKGLFHKAIGQSGGGGPPLQNLDEAIILSLKFAKKMGARTVADLRGLSAREILDGSVEHIPGQKIQAVDGWVFPDQPYDIYARGEQNKVPLLMGFNENDANINILSKYCVPNFSSAKMYRASVRRAYGVYADEFLQLYPVHDYVESSYASLRDGSFGWITQRWARMSEQHSVPVFFYYFSHVSPSYEKHEPTVEMWGGRALGAAHASEIAYVFNHLGKRYGENWPVIKPRGMEQRVADLMSDYWVAFAHSGVPNGSDLPEWKPYTAANRDYMEFKDGARMKQNLNPGAWEFQDKNLRHRLASPRRMEDCIIGPAAPPWSVEETNP